MLVADHGGSGDGEARYAGILPEDGAARPASAAERPVPAVERARPGRNRRRWTRVVEDVVGAGEALRARQLRGHDRADLVRREAAASGDPAHLLVLRTVDDEDPLHDRRESFPLEQQRHDEDAIRASSTA